MKKTFIASLTSLLIFGCSSTPQEKDVTEEKNDDIEVSEGISKIQHADRAMRSVSVYFDTDSAILPKNYAHIIDKVRQALSHDPELKVFLHGHADKRGDKTYNVDLSKKRSENILKLLNLKEETYKRVSLDFFGEDEPRCVADSAAGLSCNRRVDIYLIK